MSVDAQAPKDPRSSTGRVENVFKIKLFIGITSKATCLTNLQKHETWEENMFASNGLFH